MFCLRDPIPVTRMPGFQARRSRWSMARLLPTAGGDAGDRRDALLPRAYRRDRSTTFSLGSYRKRGPSDESSYYVEGLVMTNSPPVARDDSAAWLAAIVDASNDAIVSK